LGCDSGVSKSTVSRICKGIDAEVAVLAAGRWTTSGLSLAVARHHHRQVIAALIRTIFAQPDHATASGLDGPDWPSPPTPQF
jgi:hypothetical protein